MPNDEHDGDDDGDRGGFGFRDFGGGHAPDVGSAAANTSTTALAVTSSVAADPGTTTTVVAAPAPTLAPADGARFTVAANDGTTVQLVVTVPLNAIGVPGDGDAPLQVAVVSGALSPISYSIVTAEGKPAATTVTIGPVVDPSPVVAPI